ncbi:MAG: hypothetical protein PHW13_10130 [Methylococcales bacterium]|nr:hypothetical protein [Methylococcales bacterium]
MKANFNRHMLLAAAVMASMQTARADVNYADSAAITYTINSIYNTNPATPGDLANLSVSGAFQQLYDSNDFYAAASGDGIYTDDTPDIASTPVSGNAFNAVFSVSGDSVSYGTVDTLHTGVFSLNFSNTGTDSYAIDVSLDYVLNAAANGIYANSALFLDYWDTGNIISGSDYVGAGSYTGYSTDNASQPGSAELIFTLSPGATDSFIAQIAIQSSLDSTSTATPAPIPGAFWIFGSGLLGMKGINGRRIKHRFFKASCRQPVG